LGESFLGEAFILAVAGLISRVLGAVYRIPLTRMIGQEGIGLYQLAYPLYVMLLQISTAGINIAVSKLIAERVAVRNLRGARSVFRSALILLTVFGAVSTLLMLGLARPISVYLHRDPRSYYAILALAPAILIVSVMATFRGLFQGFSKFAPTAVSQIAEQVVRVITALGLGYLLLPRGVAQAAAGASFGATTGALAGLILIVLMYWRSGRRLLTGVSADGPSEGTGFLMGRLLALSVPISLAAIVLPLMSLIDSAVVPARLALLGLGRAEVTALYGQLTGMALPVINMPTVISSAFGLSLVPTIARAYAFHDETRVRSESQQAVRMVVLLMLPAVAGLVLLASPVMELLYGAPAAGPVLAAVAPGLLFLTLQQTTSGVLQGLGRTDLPVRNLIMGALVKVVATYALTGLPSFGIRGAALGSALGFLTAASLNIASLVRLTGCQFALGGLIQPAVATVGMGLAARWSYGLMLARWGNSVATLAAIGVGFIVYLVLMLAVRGLRARDFELLPRIGGPLANNLRRLNIISD
jgi:stage V sporulation protein B